MLFRKCGYSEGFRYKMPLSYFTLVFFNVWQLTVTVLQLMVRSPGPLRLATNA